MEKEGNNLFQVNLKGMIALLSEHIYSNPNTFVRELLQNCVDAITALRNIDENYAGRIDVFLNDDKTVIFRDNGIGLRRYIVSLPLSGKARNGIRPMRMILSEGLVLVCCLVL